MTETEQIPQTYADAVRTLARWHGEGGPADLRVFSFPDATELLFLPTGIIRPLTLRASTLFPYKSSVALASPEEWAAAERGTLALPPGWHLAASAQVWP